MISFHSKDINKNDIAKISKTVIIVGKQNKARHIKKLHNSVKLFTLANKKIKFKWL